MKELEYEAPPEEEEDERPRRKRREKRKAFMITRSPYCLEPIRVYDDESPDDKIEEFIALGNDWWLEKNDPEKAAKIRQNYLAKLEKAAKYDRKNKELA